MLCWGNLPVTSGICSQRVSNREKNPSHDIFVIYHFEEHSRHIQFYMVGQSGQKSAKGSTYEKFHVRKYTRIKSFVYKTIRVSKVSCIKWYAYQKLREIFHTCMFKDQSKLPIPYMYVFIRVAFITCKIDNVLLLQCVRFFTCTICNAYLLIHVSIFNHWRPTYTYEKIYTYRNSRVQINSR